MKKIKMPQREKTWVYCGPDIPNVIRENTAFKGDIPKAFCSLCEKCPAAWALTVELKDFPKARRDVRTVGTAFHAYYNNIKKFIEEGY